MTRITHSDAMHRGDALGPFTQDQLALFRWLFRAGFSTLADEDGLAFLQLAAGTAWLGASGDNALTLVVNDETPGGGDEAKVRIIGGNGLVLPSLTADPAAGASEDGQIYYNSTSDVVRLRANGAWTDLAGSGGAPTTADYLVGTAQGGLSAEIVVGTTPGGELGGTWASPTVDATHSGSTHSAATDTHIADASDAHDASAVSVADAGGYYTGTEVEAALQEIGSGAVIADALSALASGTGDVTTTSSLADVTGATLSLEAGTYIIHATFDVLVNNALNDRTWEGHLDSGGSDQNDYANLVAPGLVNVRATVSQSWRLVLASTTTVKLRTLHSGGSVGDFTVKSTNTTIAAYRAGGGSLGVWTSYTPAWTGSGTAPAIGNGTLEGRYKELDGTTLAVDIRLLWGSTTTGGSSSWKLGLPSGYTSGGKRQALSVWAIDSGTSYYVGVALVAASATVISEIILTNQAGTNIAGVTTPWTWATSDELIISGTLETT